MSSLYPQPQPPASLEALRAAHHMAVKLHGARSPGDKILARHFSPPDLLPKSFFKKENIFGEGIEWGPQISQSSRPIQIQNNQQNNQEELGTEEVAARKSFH